MNLVKNYYLLNLCRIYPCPRQNLNLHLVWTLQFPEWGHVFLAFLALLFLNVSRLRPKAIQALYQQFLRPPH